MKNRKKLRLLSLTRDRTDVLRVGSRWAIKRCRGGTAIDAALGKGLIRTNPHWDAHQELERRRMRGFLFQRKGEYAATKTEVEVS